MTVTACNSPSSRSLQLRSRGRGGMDGSGGGPSSECGMDTSRPHHERGAPARVRAHVTVRNSRGYAKLFSFLTPESVDPGPRMRGQPVASDGEHALCALGRHRKLGERIAAEHRQNT